MWYRWSLICFVYCSHNPVVLFSFISYNWDLTRVTWRVLLVQQNILTLRNTLAHPSVFCVVHVAQSLVFCAIMCSSLLVFVSMYLLVVILWVLHRFRLLITLLVSSTFPYRILKDEHHAMVYIILQKKLEDTNVIIQSCTSKSEAIFKIKSKTAKNTALF